MYYADHAGIKRNCEEALAEPISLVKNLGAQFRLSGSYWFFVRDKLKQQSGYTCHFENEVSTQAVENSILSHVQTHFEVSWSRAPQSDF